MQLKKLATLTIAAFAGVFALSACSSVPVGQDLPMASAVAEIHRSDMQINPADNGLTWAQLDMLAGIAAEYKDRGHGQLVISYPAGSNNEDAAIGAIAEARTFLYEHGVNWQQIAGGTYDARGMHNAAVIFSFTRYRAVAPNCNQGWENLAFETNNRHPERFGCFLAANLAEMIADPRDLIMPRDLGPVDGARRQTVLERYRAGESTSSTRSDHESGAVSSVSN